MMSSSQDEKPLTTARNNDEQQQDQHKSSPASSSPNHEQRSSSFPHPGAPPPPAPAVVVLAQHQSTATSGMMMDQATRAASFLEPSPFLESSPIPFQQLSTTSEEETSSVASHHQDRQRRRKEFALLIKILLKILWDAKEVSLYHQVRLSIATCTKRNRMGDPSFRPLEDVLEAHLWLMVGDMYWEKAAALQTQYLVGRRAAIQVRPADPSLRQLQAFQQQQARRIVPL
jgi:hypothetical protein